MVRATHLASNDMIHGKILYQKVLPAPIAVPFLIAVQLGLVFLTVVLR